jgi:hypothetical protein
MPRLLYPPGNNLWYAVWKWVGPRGGMDAMEKGKISSLPESNLDSLVIPPAT